MKRALLCFLKYPAPGQVKTRLAVDLGAERAAELYRDLTERVITEAFCTEDQYDLILCVDPQTAISEYQAWLGGHFVFWPQAGENLGKRMIHAFAQAFQQGYEQVLLIGSDCIGMDETFYEAAFARLDDHDVVIGPCPDGGYYMIGLKQAQDLLFERMPWSTAEVLSLTLDRIEALQLKVQQLEEKFDLDDLENLTRFRDALPEEHYIGKKIDRLILDRLDNLPIAND
ncbi:MAG: TIGR04282 family arsenosugar biosynthesis glycosyltransferase [Acidobacteria bacterium]|nr:TIGR04282 family arsenosugar biosynthesis glycosyltransferase [Acidobacteriota bacterium]MCB9396887.1 TIGR04282 family arsenosugar biosynthesis glycosyltransferase [Acidobacteriota bacterium]